MQKVYLSQPFVNAQNTVLHNIPEGQENTTKIYFPHTFNQPNYGLGLRLQPVIYSYDCGSDMNSRNLIDCITPT